MAELGNRNPIPFKIGGGPSKTQQALGALNQSVGKGGASPDGTIRAAWYLAKARGLSASYADERAINQTFPDLATDALPVYEEILDTPPAPDASEQKRRDDNTRLWTLSNVATTSDLEDALQEIDSNITIEDIDRDYTTVTQLGRAFQDEIPTDPDASGPPFNIGKQTDWPNYSNEMVCYTNLNLSGVPTAVNLKNIEEAKAVLNDRLPSWVDFVTFSGIGFFLDVDLLDLGAFGDYPAGTTWPPP
jgi:hypothetical protein